MLFTRYVALGDSVSIDLYPALDAGETDVAVNLERHADAGAVAPLGAASLFYRNDEARWPAEQGDDLVSRYPGITLHNLAEDGASIGDVFGSQLAQLEETDEPTLVTLTAGGNDLLSAVANRPRASLLDAIANDVADAYEFLLDAIRRAVPNGLIITATIYDPSDGSGVIPGMFDELGELPLAVLERLNKHIRRLTSGTPRTALADIHEHFLGHGASSTDDERWYWRRSLIEPNAAGASEIRTLWRQVLDEHNPD